MNKKLNLFLSVCVLAFAMAIPLFSFAVSLENIKSIKDNAENARNMVEQKLKSQAKFDCSKIFSALNQVRERVNQSTVKITAKRVAISENINQFREEKEVRIEDKRLRWDDNREARWQKLLGRAKSSVQKGAVEKFIDAVEEAVEKRREKFDGAIQAFQQEIDGLKTERKQAAEQEAKRYGAAQEEVFSNAQTLCEEGIDLLGVRQSLNEELKQVRAGYKENIKNLDYNKRMQELIEAKKTVMKSAMDEFHTAMQKALEELKKSFFELKAEVEQAEQITQ